MDCEEQKEACRTCGAYCCRLGGTAATKEELTKILEAGHPNHFIQISEDCYVTPWGHDGVCPYLNDTICSIYNMRPIVCRKFPIVTLEDGERLIAHCPLVDYLTKRNFDYLIRLSTCISTEVIAGSRKYLLSHKEEIADRIQRFSLERLVRIM